eukprot:TRINITY_DN147_c0_g1_i5.p1 TRINITY_DN147_c0_g1~~TRINITY_DN147_c0_g1_i5.p1  ORF type:complete len:2387 (+),score=646.33 TRINITY_DN147_c0_g1_i5:145-7161(+)
MCIRDRVSTQSTWGIQNFLKTNMKVILLILALSTIAYSGQIWSWADPDSDNNQIGSSPSITLYFGLETPLEPWNYLRVDFPTSLTGVAVSAKVFATNSRCGDNGDPFTKDDSVERVDGDANSVFFQFDKTLQPKTMYSIQLDFGSLASYSSAGLSGTIGLYTTTSAIAKYIIIDSNPAFADFEWVASTASLTLSENAADNDTIRKDFSANYGYNFSFNSTLTYLGGANVVIMLTNNAFTVSACTVLAIGNLTTSLPACSLKNNVASFVALSGLNGKVTMKLSVTNPSNAITKSGLSVNIYRRLGSQLIESGSSADDWFATKWTTGISNNTVQLAFGVDPKTDGHPLRFYKGISGKTGSGFYQTYRFTFKPNASLPTKFTNTLEIGLGATNENLLIQDASVHHNLDGLTSRRVVCKVVESGGKKYIQCSPVALSTNAYFVSVRILAKQDLSALPDGFGTFTVKATKNGDDLGSTPTSGEETLISATYSTVDLLQMNVIHDYGAGAESTRADRQLATLMAAEQKLYFVSSANNSMLLTYWMNIATAGNVLETLTGKKNGVGVDIYVNKYVSFGANNGTINVFVTDHASTGEVAFSWATGSNSSSSQNYARWRGGFTSGDANNISLDTGADNTNVYVKILNASITRAPSIRADEASFEFYIGFITNYANSSVTDFTYNSKNGFYSVLTMMGPGTTGTPFAAAFRTFGVGVVAGYLGDPNTGRYPALLRAVGNLTAAESNGSKSLAIFFNNLVPYQQNANNDNTVLCYISGTAATNYSCTLIEGATASDDADITSNADVVYGYSRIEVNWAGISSTNGFQVIIPVAVKAAGKTDIFVATLDGTTGSPIAFGRTATGTTAATVDKSGDNNDIAYTPHVDDISIVRFKFSVNSSDVVGSSGAQTLKIGTNSSTIAAKWNESSVNVYGETYSVAAGVQYCAVWDFIGKGALGNNQKQISNQGDDKCVSYSLKVRSDGLPTTASIDYAEPNKWCIFCPIGANDTLSTSTPTSIVNLTNYTYWAYGTEWVAKSIAGASATVGCLFTKDGLAIACDDSYDAVNNGNITGLSAISITNTSVSNRISYTLNLANAFPVGSSLGGLTISERIISWRVSAVVGSQEAGGKCVVRFGDNKVRTCTLSLQESTAPEAETTTSTKPNYIKVDSELPAGTKAITIVIDGFSPPTTTSNISVNIAFATRVNWGGSYTTLMDLSTNSTFAITTGTTTPTMQILSPSYEQPLRGFRSALRIPFKIEGRSMYKNEKVVITFNNAAYTSGVNAPANLLCEVVSDSTAPVLFTQIQTCTVDSTSITIESLLDLPKDSTPVIVLRGFTPVDLGNTSLSGQLMIGSKQIQATAASPSTPISPVSTVPSNASTAFGANDVVITRIQNQIGATSVIQIVIKNAGTVDSNWRILVDFPYYYGPSISNLMRLTFEVNGLQALGMVNNRLVIVPLPATINNGTDITLRIIGVNNPRIPTGATGNFWIALDNDMKNDTLKLMGSYSDIAAAVEPTSSIWPYSISFETDAKNPVLLTRSSATLKIVAIINTAFSVNQIISLDFPKSWSQVVAASGAQAVSCSATSSALNGTQPTGNVTNSAVPASPAIRGNTIRLNVTATISAGSQITITCTNFRTPDEPFAGDCLPETPTIVQFDTNESTPLSRSSPSTHHLERKVVIPFTTAKDNLVSLSSPTPGTEVIVGTIQLPQQFLIITPPERLSRSLTINLANTITGVSLIKETGVGNIGEPGVVVGFSAAATAAVGIYPVILNKVESFLATSKPAYNQPPTFHLVVSNRKAKITGPSPNNEVKIPVGGTSVPLVYTLEYAPSVETAFTLTASDPALTISTIAPVKPGENMIYFTLTVPATATAGNTTYTVNLTAPSTAVAFSEVPPPLKITVTEAVTDTPNVAIAVDSDGSNAILQNAKLTITLPTTSTATIGPHTVYHACSISSITLNRDLAYVQNIVKNPPPAPGQSSQDQIEVFGWQIIDAPASAGDSYQFTELKANTTYNCRVWAVNQAGKSGSAALNFTTATNEGKVVRFIANFLNNTEFSTSKIATTLCWLAQAFALSPRQLRAQTGERCEQTPKPITWNINFLMSNISGEMVNHVPIYVLPRVDVVKDEAADDVIASIKDVTFLKSLTDSAPKTFSTPVLLNNSYPNNAPPVYEAPTTTNATDSTPLSFTFKPPTGNTVSFIFVGIWVANGSVVPSFADVTPFRSTGRDPIAYGVGYYNGSQFDSPSVTIPSSVLTQGTDYVAYWVATCDNPTEMAMMCASGISNSIGVGKGANPVVETGNGSTDARLLSVSFTLLAAFLLSFLIQRALIVVRLNISTICVYGDLEYPRLHIYRRI